jgi:WXXGXW repeat (2 copies)
MEVEARGPVHEAYGEPANASPTASPVVEKEPPAAIEESPPEEEPEGDNVVWVPGYWAWDEDAGEYL